MMTQEYSTDEVNAESLVCLYYRRYERSLIKIFDQRSDNSFNAILGNVTRTKEETKLTACIPRESIRTDSPT